MRFVIILKICFILAIMLISNTVTYSQSSPAPKYGLEIFGGVTMPIADLKNQPSGSSYGIGITGIYRDTKYYALFLNLSYNRVKAPDSIDINNLPIEGITKLSGGVMINILPSLNVPYIEIGLGMYYLKQFEAHVVPVDNTIGNLTITESSFSKFGYTLGLGQNIPVDKNINAVLKIKFNQIVTRPISKYYFEFLGGFNYEF